MHFKLAAFIAVLALTAFTTAAPVGGSQQHACEPEEDLDLTLDCIDPAVSGLGNGLKDGAGHVKAAIATTGEALNQIANGVGDVAASATYGLGETVQSVPAAVIHTAHAIDHSPGIVGKVGHIVFGEHRGIA